MGFHVYPVAHRQRDDVGEVVLALRVVVLQFGDPPLQLACRHGEDAGVDFMNCALGGRRVLVLDNARDLAVFAHDAAVAVRMRQVHRQQPQLSGLRRGHQRLQGRGVRQRHIAIQHQRDAAVRQLGQRLFHGMAGAVLFGLKHKRQPVVSHRLRHGLTAKTVHHADLRGAEFMGRIHHVPEQGLARQRVQHLGQVGAHAGAFARREYQDFKLGFHSRVRMVSRIGKMNEQNEQNARQV